MLSSQCEGYKKVGVPLIVFAAGNNAIDVYGCISQRRVRDFTWESPLSPSKKEKKKRKARYTGTSIYCFA